MDGGYCCKLQCNVLHPLQALVPQDRMSDGNQAATGFSPPPHPALVLPSVATISPESRHALPSAGIPHAGAKDRALGGL
jgi:hypothetical protein